jgi:hypothetical protein
VRRGGLYIARYGSSCKNRADLFDGLTVMISACHFQAKRGRSGFDSPSESYYQLFRVHVPEHCSERQIFCFVL